MYDFHKFPHKLKIDLLKLSYHFLSQKANITTRTKQKIVQINGAKR